MATLQKLQEQNQKRQERVNRYFSESFKRKKVSEIERNITSIPEICREYNVSRTSVYRWIYEFSNNMKKGVKQVVEAKSDTVKIQQLKDQVKELERIVGQKQILIDFQQKMIDIAEEEYRVDIKKKYGSKLSHGSGQTGKSTTTQ
jgi:transposase